ncbi:hypothetical protein H7K45_00140 [Mycobacterium yunnanensis]|uniref:Uncharacterized protein n=1 Tax=Mycobacterium yunnanensis TaxID=368477 RepID=A0A9X3BY99_9MYCO|nr:hypothetical protein [Mycobacterium yunnanensis]MCV7418943.1 hypothetical protein [Mycobacterium yunnanensis]
MTLQQNRIRATPSGRSRGEHDRDDGHGAHRAIGAAILAGGVALSISVHPVQGGRGPVDALTPGHRMPTDASTTTGPMALTATLDFAYVTLPDLVRLVGFTDLHPEVSTDALMGLVTEFGIRNVVASFEFLSAMGPVHPLVNRVPDHDGDGLTGSDGDVMNSLAIVLALLNGNGILPDHYLLDVLRNVLSHLVAPSDRPPTSAALPPGPTDVTLALAPSPLTDPLVSTRMVADTSTAPPPPSPSPPPDSDVVAPTQTPDLLPTETPSPTTDAAAPVTAVSSIDQTPAPSPSESRPETDPQPDPPKANPTESDPPKSDPPSAGTAGSGDVPSRGAGSGSSSSGSAGEGGSAGGSSGAGDPGGSSGAGE